MQSDMRAFVGAESAYSNAQKQSTYFLNRYSESHLEKDYQQFLQSISIPLASNAARNSLEQHPPNYQSASASFLKAKNHPDDIGGMMKFFVRFRNTNLLKEPIAIWTQADTYVAQLKKAGDELHTLILNYKATDSKASRVLMQKIHVINTALSPLEYSFSNTLGVASRQINLIIFYSRLIITVFLLTLGILLTRRIVSENVKSTNELLQIENRLTGVLDTSMDAVVQMNQEGFITRWSGQAANIFGWNAKEVIGKTMLEIIVPPHLRSAHSSGLNNFMTTGKAKILNNRIETLALRQDGSEFSIELTVSEYRYAGKHEFTAFIRDITSRKKTSEQLIQLAHFDTITNLPNRVLFYDRLEQEIKKAQRVDLSLAVLLLDLDYFKEVNDTLGHDKGDLLLKEAAHRLINCVRQSDTVARLGGDEFTFIMPSIKDKSGIERLAQKILLKLSEPFYLDDNVVYISGSIGITIFPEDAKTIDELLKNADQAMYEAKKHGRNRFFYFTPIMQAAAKARVNLASDLRTAIAENQFIMVYQPIIDFADNSIKKAEALIRWQHPTRGMVSPIEFIPIAEETGLIVEIGDWVFQQAAKQVQIWREKIHADFQISVNKSPVQFYKRSSMHTSWFNYLESLNLPGNSIVIEITEGLLLDASQYVNEHLFDLRNSGFLIAIDDFGTGYSSLSYLKKFEIDFIKIDRSFVSNLAPASSDLVLCEAIIVMAHKLGMKVIAEGIETSEQQVLLSEAGCDYAQGYLFSKPVSVKEFENLLKV